MTEIKKLQERKIFEATYKCLEIYEDHKCKFAKAMIHGNPYRLEELQHQMKMDIEDTMRPVVADILECMEALK